MLGWRLLPTAMTRKTHIDETEARAAFENALATYEQDFGKFFLARLFGLELAYTADECIITFDLKEFMLNPQGGIHGGITAFALDVSMGHLLRQTSGPGTTIEMKVQYLKAARSGRLTCTARFIRQGRSISFLRSELVDEHGEMIAYATSTWKLLKQHHHPAPKAG
jgi:uncharacterized protein (TIGR00369 family)